MDSPRPPALTDDMIRARAYRIWEREGRPDSRADEHWRMACRELAVEIASKQREEADQPEPVEPLEAVENQGSFLSLTDQDEEVQYPRRRRRAQGKRADLPPI